MKDYDAAMDNSINSETGIKLQGKSLFFTNEDYIQLNDQDSIKLEPLVSQTLLYLINNSERPISIDELLNKVWGCRFKSQKVVNRSICLVRKALLDNTSEPTFIKTIPKRGYRFIGKFINKDDHIELLRN